MTDIKVDFIIIGNWTVSGLYLTKGAQLTDEISAVLDVCFCLATKFGTKVPRSNDQLFHAGMAVVRLWQPHSDERGSKDPSD